MIHTQEVRDKQNNANKRWLNKVKKEDPERYTALRLKKREYATKWRQTIKDEDPARYREMLRKHAERMRKYRRDKKAIPLNPEIIPDKIDSIDKLDDFTLIS